MDARPTLIFVGSIFGIILLLLIVRLLKHGARRRRERRFTAQISATITQIQMRTSHFSSGWQVIASSVDRRTGHRLTFRSSPLEFRPLQQVGDQIQVHYDPRQPQYYRMEL